MSATEALHIVKALLARDQDTAIEKGGRFLTNRERQALAKLSDLARGLIFGPHGFGRERSVPRT